MTNRQIQDLLSENMIRADIQSEKGFLRIITDETVPEGLQNRIRMHAPVGVLVSFVVSTKKKIPVPKSLENWVKNTKTGPA